MTHLFSAGMEYQEQEGSPYLRQPENTRNRRNNSFKGMAHQVTKDSDSFPEIWEINEAKPTAAGLLQFCEHFQATALRREPRRRLAASLSRGDRAESPGRGWSTQEENCIHYETTKKTQYSMKKTLWGLLRGLLLDLS